MFKDRQVTFAPINSGAQFVSSFDRELRALADAENSNMALILHLREKWFRSRRFTSKRSRFQNG